MKVSTLEAFVFFITHIVSIYFGKYYRTIADKQIKKQTSTLIGILFIVLIAQRGLWYIIVLSLVYITILCFTDNKIKFTLATSFATISIISMQIIYIQLELFEYSSHSLMVQALLHMRFIGLANDMTAPDHEPYLDQLGVIDVVNYVFNYVGILTGPYYSYKTYIDSIELPFSARVDATKATLKRIAHVPVYLVLMLIMMYIAPIWYLESDEFIERSWLYRFWYCIPLSVTLQLQLFIGLQLAECICIMAGVGAYPAFTEPKIGKGPTKRLEEMKELAIKNDEEAVVYDFTTIRSVEPYKMETCVTFRESTRYMSSTVQYLLVIAVYKRFPFKNYKLLMTLLASGIGHGTNCGHFLSCAFVLLIIVVEDVYIELFEEYHKDKSMNWVKWIHRAVRLQMGHSQFMPLILLEAGPILRYYQSVYWYIFVQLAVMYAVGVTLLALKKRKTMKKDL